MQVLDILLILAIAALSLGFLSMLFVYLKLIKKLEAEEKQLNKHYLKQAKTKASEIVSEAGQEALSLLSDSRVVGEKDQLILDEVVKQLSQNQSAFLKASIDELMQDFKQELQQIKNYNINTLSNVSKDIEKDTSSQLQAYEKSLEEQTVSSEKIVSKKIEDEYKQIQEEIENYKKEQMAKIDKTINTMLKQVFEEILQKSITPQDHKDLILKTLEKAKNESVFIN